MADAELQTFRDQLAFVNLSLEADPENADLLSLKTELLEIIELTQAANPSAAAASAPVGGSASGKGDDAAHSGKGKGREGAGTGAGAGAAAGSGATSATAGPATGASGSNTNWQDQGTFKAGNDCMAKYRDGKW